MNADPVKTERIGKNAPITQNGERAMRKLLVLGGTYGQVPLIEAAKKEGYGVVLVDYTDDHPGIPLSDKHYQVSYMDRDAVLEIARQEDVAGVISNAEAAMPIVAYISEKRNLVGNPWESVLRVSSKNDFRILQKEIGVYAPEHIVTNSFEEAQQQVSKLTFPIVIKPSRSYGSQGTTKVTDREMFEHCRETWEICSEYSRDDQVVLEEYVETLTPDRTIEGDVFVCNGQFLWDGLFTNKRSLKAPLVPMMDVFPILLEEEQLREVKETIEQLFRGAGIRFGQYNIEMFYTTGNRLFCIEINPRQGGNGIPGLVQQHCGVDMYRLLVTTAMGDNGYFEEVLSHARSCRYIVRQMVFSHQDGIFREVYIAPELKPYVTDVRVFPEPGDAVYACCSAADIIAWVDLEFETREQQISFLKMIEEEIYPICG